MRHKQEDHDLKRAIADEYWREMELKSKLAWDEWLVDKDTQKQRDLQAIESLKWEERQ